MYAARRAMEAWANGRPHDLRIILHSGTVRKIRSISVSEAHDKISETNLTKSPGVL